MSLFAFTTPRIYTNSLQAKAAKGRCSWEVRPNMTPGRWATELVEVVSVMAVRPGRKWSKMDAEGEDDEKGDHG